MKIENVKNFLWKYNPVTIPAMIVQNSFLGIPREVKIMNLALSVLVASAATFRPNLREILKISSCLDNSQLFVISACVTLATLTLISGIGVTVACGCNGHKIRQFRKSFQNGINQVF